MMAMFKRLVPAILLAMILLVPHAAKADWYWFKMADHDDIPNAKIIAQPSRLQRFFGRLETRKDVDYFTLTLDKDEEFHASLFVPKADAEFKPALVFFGPDVKSSGGDPEINIGAGNGSIMVRNAAEDREAVFEDVLLTSFYGGTELSFKAEKRETYGIAIKSPDGERGRYMLKIGQTDDWKWSELPTRIWGATKAIFRLY
jgi:hypothetical protein